MDTLLLIDGNAMMHRAYHALPPLTSRSGIQTNILYGFLGMLIKANDDFAPTHIIVCFDTPKPTFRKTIFKEYQAHRPQLEDSFKAQIPLLKEMLTATGIPMFEQPGYEADDIIGTIAEKYKRAMRVLILTGDKDIMQLVDKNVFVITPKLGLTNISLYGETEVKEKLGVEPASIPELKGLMGDPSDNYPGAKGIGPKTAVKLLEQFKTAENVVKNADRIDNERIKHIIKDHAEDVLLSKKLATILTDVPISCDVEKTRFTGFTPGLQQFLAKYDIKSLSNRIFGTKTAAKPPQKKEREEVNSNQEKLF